MNYSSKLQKKQESYEHGDGSITNHYSYLWRVYDDFQGGEGFNSITPEYYEGKFEFFLSRTWLIHKLIFMTIFKYARIKPIHKSLLVRGIGQPTKLSQLAGILGNWESIGFLKKVGKGKTALYYFDPAVYDFSWQGKTERQTRDFRHILSIVNLTERFIEKAHQRAIKQKESS